MRYLVGFENLKIFENLLDFDDFWNIENFEDFKDFVTTANISQRRGSIQ